MYKRAPPAEDSVGVDLIEYLFNDKSFIREVLLVIFASVIVILSNFIGRFQ